MFLLYTSVVFWFQEFNWSEAVVPCILLIGEWPEFFHFSTLIIKKIKFTEIRTLLHSTIFTADSFATYDFTTGHFLKTIGLITDFFSWYYLFPPSRPCEITLKQSFLPCAYEHIIYDKTKIKCFRTLITKLATGKQKETPRSS